MTTPTTSTPPAPARVEFGPAIRAAAVAAGRVPTEQQLADLDHDLNERHFVDPETGHVNVATAAGPVLDAQSAIRNAVQAWPLAEPVAQPNSAEFTTLRINGSTSTRRAADPIVKLITGLQAAEAAKTAAEVATWPNPWRRGGENRTRQTIIRNTNPALAEKFKREAGL